MLITDDKHCRNHGYDTWTNHVSPAIYIPDCHNCIFLVWKKKTVISTTRDMFNISEIILYKIQNLNTRPDFSKYMHTNHSLYRRYVGTRVTICLKRYLTFLWHASIKRFFFNMSLRFFRFCYGFWGENGKISFGWSWWFCLFVG
jgi:hypothetical protein